MRLFAPASSKAQAQTNEKPLQSQGFSAGKTVSKSAANMLSTTIIRL